MVKDRAIAQLEDALTQERVRTFTPVVRLFYGCSYMFHLSGDNNRDRYITPLFFFSLLFFSDSGRYLFTVCWWRGLEQKKGG